MNEIRQDKNALLRQLPKKEAISDVLKTLGDITKHHHSLASFFSHCVRNIKDLVNSEIENCKTTFEVISDLIFNKSKSPDCFNEIEKADKMLRQNNIQGFYIHYNAAKLSLESVLVNCKALNLKKMLPEYRMNLNEAKLGKILCSGISETLNGIIAGNIIIPVPEIEKIDQKSKRNFAPKKLKKPDQFKKFLNKRPTPDSKPQRQPKIPSKVKKTDEADEISRILKEDEETVHYTNFLIEGIADTELIARCLKNKTGKFVRYLEREDSYIVEVLPEGTMYAEQLDGQYYHGQTVKSRRLIK